MEAKDTVMNDATKRQFRYIPDKPSQDVSRWDIESMLLLQAELTAPIFFEEGYKAGTREIVEWLQQYAIRGRNIPLHLVLEDLETHSSFIRWSQVPSLPGQ